MKTTVVHGQDSWQLQNNNVNLYLTRHGGMMAPVTFTLPDGSKASPYYVSPWQDENLPIDEPVLIPLRGDFFCAPFGAGSEFGGVAYASHGPTATAEWAPGDVTEEAGEKTLTATMETGSPVGIVTKRISIRDGESVIYVSHALQGVTESMPAGHHATLSAEPDAPWLITTSPIRFGMVDTANAPVYTAEEYRSLAAGARFERIEAVPTVWKDAPESDCSRFPAREGFVDIMAVANEQEEGVPAWTVASKPAEGYLWFSLKDPAVLPTTVFWMENRGRHGAPWNGRNRCIGLEDVCAAFAGGMAASHADNPLRREGVRTLLDPDRSGRITVDYIEGVIAVPTDFGRATSVSFGDEVIRITGSDGSTVETPVAWKRIFGANE